MFALIVDGDAQQHLIKSLVFLLQHKQENHAKSLKEEDRANCGTTTPKQIFEDLVALIGASINDDDTSTKMELH